MLLNREIPLNAAEWRMWKDHPATRIILDALADERSIWVQRLAFGETLEKAGSEIVETAKAVGVVSGLTVILEDMEIALQQQWLEAQERQQREEEESEE